VIFLFALSEIFIKISFSVVFLEDICKLSILCGHRKIDKIILKLVFYINLYNKIDPITLPTIQNNTPHIITIGHKLSNFISLFVIKRSFFS